MNIEQANFSTISELWAGIEPRIVSAARLEDAAQALTAGLYGLFDESIVLTRIFITVPFAQLPKSHQQYVRKLLNTAQAIEDLKPQTPVLSLIGTYGLDEDWRDRRRSKAHVGIPLVSSSFIEAVPMISRLLKELGLPVEWVDSHDSEMVVNAIGHVAGLFFVKNAATATDDEGRHIIASQDFVARHQVRSTFGVGGAYATGQIAVIVSFCNSQFPRSVAERFLPLATLFVGKTGELVAGNRIFHER